MPKPKYGKTVTEARKLRENLQRRIRRAVERGYRFEEKLPEIPKTTKYKDYKPYYKKLQEWDREFYKKATAVSDESGEIISGEQKRKEERRESARKSAQTREERKREREREREEGDEETKWRKEREKQDEEERERSTNDFEYREKINRGSIIIDRVYEMIRDATYGHKESADYLRNVLDEEIARYGRQRVALAIEPFEGEFLESCETALMYRVGSPQHTAAINNILMIIRGEMPTAEESAHLNDLWESDEDAEGEFQ